MIFILVLYPKTHLVPGRMAFLSLQVRHHHQLLFIPFFPTNEYGPFHSLPMLTPLAYSSPTSPASLNAHTHWTEVLFSWCQKTQILFHALHWVPPQPLNSSIEPGGIKSPVRHHDP